MLASDVPRRIRLLVSNPAGIGEWAVRAWLVGLAAAAVISGTAVGLWSVEIVSFDAAPTAASALLAVGWLVLICMGAQFLASKPNAATLVTLAAIALLVRLAAFIWLGTLEHEAGSDQRTYLVIANNILEGNGIVIGKFRALFPPAYPVALAISGKILGLAPASVAIVNTSIDLMAAWTLLQIGSAYNRRCGYVGAWLYLMWPAFVLGSPIPQKEGLAILLTLQIALALVRQIDKFRWIETARLGAAVGLVGLSQPALLPFAGCLSVALLPFFKVQRLAAIAAGSIPVAVLVLLPWWTRNWLVFETFVPFTTSQGFSHLVAATGLNSSIARPATLPELEGSKVAAQMAIEFVRAQPYQALYNKVILTGHALSLEVWPSMRLIWMPDLRHQTALIATVTQSSYIVALVAASAGSRVCRNSVLTSFMIACIIQIVLFSPLVEFAERHRYFMVPFILLLCSAWIVRIVDTRKAKLHGGAGLPTGDMEHTPSTASFIRPGASR